MRDLKYFLPGLSQFRKQIAFHVGSQLLNDVLSHVPGTVQNRKFFSTTVGVEPEVNWNTIKRMRKAFSSTCPT